VEARRRRGPRQGRREAEDALPDVDERRARQKTQAIVKQAAARAGIEIEIKSVVASVFFGSDLANPDNYPKFYSDIQMYNNGPGAPDPQNFMLRFVSLDISSKEN
jgi:peptide/nickel transport system substrate-binding protein